MSIIGQGFCERNRLCVWIKTPSRVGKKFLDYSFLNLIIKTGCFLEAAWLSYCNGNRLNENAFWHATSGLRTIPSMSKRDAALVKRVLRSTPNKPPTRKEILEFFSVIEQAILSSNAHLSSLRQLILSSRQLFRAGIDAWFQTGRLGFSFHDIKDFLGDLPTNRRTDAMTLSSFEDTSSKAPEAIADLSFTTIQEAREKQQNHLDTRSTELQEKCLAVLECWEIRKAKMIELSQLLTPTSYLRIKDVVNRYRKKSPQTQIQLPALNAIDVAELAAFYIKEFIQEQFYVYENALRFAGKHKTTYPHGNRVIDYFSQNAIKGFNSRNQIFTYFLCSLAYYGANELIAIQVSILLETGLNPQPLQNLHITQCVREKGQTARWKLMPIKEKTGRGQQISLTSTVGTIDENSDYVIKHTAMSNDELKKSAFDAMEMLISNYNLLLKHWAFSNDSEGYLFVYPMRTENLLAQRRFNTWGQVFDEFKQQQNINPKYTLKQIRNQVGSQIVVRYNGNLFAVRTQLGHDSIATSAGYVAQVLAGIDEAIINQFERQIAATIMFAIGGEDALYAHHLQREDVNTKTIPIFTLTNKLAPANNIKHKLTPVGNGIGCVNPSDSPNHTIQPGNFCDAEQCYSCKHQKIIITEDRIKENITMLRYIKNNLESICARNPEHWVNHGINAFAFQIALSHVICSNVHYKNIYKKIESEISKKIDYQSLDTGSDE